jgi:hypothetical protein
MQDGTEIDTVTGLTIPVKATRKSKNLKASPSLEASARFPWADGSLWLRPP